VPCGAPAEQHASFREAFERRVAELEAAAACRDNAPERLAQGVIFSDPEMDETAGNDVRAYYKVAPRKRSRSRCSFPLQGLRARGCLSTSPWVLQNANGAVLIIKRHSVQDACA
jgi:hypothetical protein